MGRTTPYGPIGPIWPPEQVKIVGRGRESVWSLWLHPSALSRIATLVQTMKEPQWALRFRRRLAWAAMTIALGYVAAALIMASAGR